MYSNYQNYQDLNEGKIRGFATIPKRTIKELIGNISDEIKTATAPKVKIKHIRKRLDKFKRQFDKMEIDLKDSDHKIIKFINQYSRWRYYVWLNDKVYNEVIDKIIKDNKSKQSIFDLSWTERDIPEIRKIKSKEGVMRILEKYENRLNHIEELIEKYPEKEKQLNAMLNWGLHGLRDLFTSIHSVISYGSKGI